MISYIENTSKMLVFEIRLDFGVIMAVLLGLLLLGILYNLLVEHLTNRGYAEGFMSLIVVCGVIFTLVGVAIVSVPAAVLVFLAFCASGLPMVVGSITRYMRMREKFQHDLISRGKEKR